MNCAFLARYRWLLRRFSRDSKGVSAVEFAMVLPFMLVLYLGTVELGNGFAAKFKATLAVRTVTDLASQKSSISTAQMSGILDLSASVMTPFPTTNMAITLSEITTDSSGNGTIVWSCSIGGTARTWGASYTMPTSLKSPGNITVLLGEVTYPYTPAIGYVVTNTINLQQSLYFYPRVSTAITGPGSTASSCPTS